MTRRPTRPDVLLVLLAALAVVACQTAQPSASPPVATSAPTSPPGSTAPPESDPPSASPSLPPAPLELDRLAITLEPFAEVDGGPLAMTSPDDGSGRLFVAAQDGRIWSVAADGSVGGSPMVNLGPRLTSGGEQGLLGIAVHPEFPTDPRIFVNYTNREGDTIVASLRLDPNDPNRFDPDSHQRLLFVDQPYSNHNGGGVVFGADGMLYLSLGDGGSGGDPHDNGQRLDTLLGKILRIDVGPAAANDYTIPPDNPFLNRDGEDEIWHFGLRNPWRVSVDRATGDLWIGDVGQGSWEEIDVARVGEGGLNFGWNTMEGAHCFRVDQCNRDGLTLPVSDYGRDIGCTVIGGYVYRGSAFPFLVGAYLFADYCTDRIMAIDAATNEYMAPVQVGTGSGSIAAFGEGADGELYVLSLQGTVSRLVASQR